MGVFEKAEAEAGHVDGEGAKVGKGENGFESFLLVGEAHLVEAEEGADEVGGAEFFDDGEDGAVVMAADVHAGEEEG